MNARLLVEERVATPSPLSTSTLAFSLTLIDLKS